MSAYVPTTEQIRTEWALSNPGGSPTTVMHAEAAFNRWLAAHDAEKRSEWEAEQGTEYGACYQADNGRELLWFSMGNSGYAIREAAEKEVERYADAQIKLCHRRKAGPWVPVEQGDDQTTNHEVGGQSNG